MTGSQLARLCTTLVFLLISGLALTVAPTRAIADEQATAAEESKGANDAIIRELIDKLGSDSYASRIRARNQLKSYGLEAFDALREAQNHDDNEVLLAARYLIASLQVSWSKETDPKEVREILLEYGAQTETERLGRIELLGRLKNQLGIEALARLARFERSVPLSRRAAMLVLNQPLNSEKVSREQLADRIDAVVGDSESDATLWLVSYADDLREGGYSAERWSDLVSQQRVKVDSGMDPDVTSASIIELIRVLAERAISENSRGPAMKLVMDHLDLVPPATRDLARQSNWAIRHRMYPVVTALYDRHVHAFSENAELLYSAAQSFDEIGKSELSEQLALQALGIQPFPEVPEGDEQEDGDFVTDHQLEEIAYAHNQVAAVLRMRGRYAWSERENLAVVDHCDIESIVGLTARNMLAVTYSEQLRHRDAANILQEIADRAKKDRLYQQRMIRWHISLNEIQSLYEFEGAMALLEENGADENTLGTVKSKMQTAYQLNSTNIDILIRMYRLDDPNDPDWKPTVVKQLTQNREKIAQEISRIELRRKAARGDEYTEDLGDRFNMYAWLVSNTEGDFELALKYSQQSIEFLDKDQVSSRAARLDTCARCYFALQRYDEAVETQKKALELEPHSLPMQRQLAQFEQALQ